MVPNCCKTCRFRSCKSKDYQCYWFSSTTFIAFWSLRFSKDKLYFRKVTSHAKLTLIPSRSNHIFGRPAKDFVYAFVQYKSTKSQSFFTLPKRSQTNTHTDIISPIKPRELLIFAKGQWPIRSFRSVCDVLQKTRFIFTYLFEKKWTKMLTLLKAFANVFS